MNQPLAFVKTENVAMSVETMLAAADRVRDRVATNLVFGASTFTKAYTFPADAFGAEFRLYRPLEGVRCVPG
jgi:hypothetical protein